MRREMDDGKISPAVRHGRRRSASPRLSRPSQDPRPDAAVVRIRRRPVLACPSRPSQAPRPFPCGSRNQIANYIDMLRTPCLTRIAFSRLLPLFAFPRLLPLIYYCCHWEILEEQVPDLAEQTSPLNSYLISPSREAPRRADLTFKFELSKNEILFILPYTRPTRFE